MNARQQERIIKVATADQQWMANIYSFKVPSLSFIDSLISDKSKTTLWEVILKLTGLEERLKSTKIFISVEKDKYGNFILYYKSKYYHDASIIANYLPAMISKQY